MLLAFRKIVDTTGDKPREYWGVPYACDSRDDLKQQPPGDFALFQFKDGKNKPGVVFLEFVRVGEAKVTEAKLTSL